MFAVVETGGKQYKVSPGQRIKVDQLTGEVNDEILLDKVLMVVDGESVNLGQPIVGGTVVRATIVEHTKGDKIVVFKYKSKKRYRRTMGFRSRLTTLQINSIGSNQEKESSAKKDQADEAKTAPEEVQIIDKTAAEVQAGE